MKKFWTVFEFEISSYLKNKSFMITTIVITVLLFGATFLPSIFDMSNLLGTNTGAVTEEQKDEEEESDSKIGIVDGNGYFADPSMLKEAFGDTEFLVMETEDELKKAVQSEMVEAGFIVEDDLHYRYLILNREMYDDNQMIFEEILEMVHKQVYCATNNLDYEKMMTEYEAPVNCEEEILGKDAEDNFWYCYVLVILIFMIIILHGVMIATSVTTEKSNRSVEVLVTSVDSTVLLFGKVFAGALMALAQTGLILGAALVGYRLNQEAWGHKLDMLLAIPGSVLVAFAVFGIGGFLFYAFLYGAMGALVSKTEDINKTAGTIQMVITIVYVLVLTQLYNPQGIIIKVCSYLPISSYSAMFVRIGMGQVEMWEIVVSAVILYASIFGTGWLAAKIYRMGTLRYGNPIKFTVAIKNLRADKK